MQGHTARPAHMNVMVKTPEDMLSGQAKSAAEP